MIDKAQMLRDEAVSILQQDRLQPRDVAEARAKVNQAFALIKQAVRIVLDGPLRRLRNRLEELMRQVEHLVLGGGCKAGERLLREAKQIQRECENAFAAKDFAKAAELCDGAMTVAKQALQLCQKIIEEKRRFENLRDRARDAVERSGNQRAKEVYHKALNLAGSAEEALRNGDTQLAKRLYNQSLMLLVRAMDMANVDSPQVIDQTDVARSRLKELMAQARECLRESNQPRARLLFERARRLATEAELAGKEGRHHEALWKVELAEKMLRRVCQMSGDGDGRRISNRISHEIVNAKTDIAEARSKLAGDAPKDAEMLINMAEFAIDRAERALNARRDRFALAAVLASQRFLTHVERVLQTQDKSDVTKEIVQLQLQRLDEAIAESENRIQLASEDWNRHFLNGAKEIRQFVVESIQKGNYRAAHEGIQVAFDLVRKSLKSVPRN